MNVVVYCTVKKEKTEFQWARDGLQDIRLVLKTTWKYFSVLNLDFMFFAMYSLILYPDNCDCDF